LFNIKSVQNFRECLSETFYLASGVHQDSIASGNFDVTKGKKGYVQIPKSLWKFFTV
jgi:hypothetical protein